jgi:hypothetical protein
MLKTTALAIAASIFATAAIAQTSAPDPVTIKVSRQALQVIGQGLAELPLKTAAPILNDLQAQLNAADKAAQDAAEKPQGAAPGVPTTSPPQK